MNLLLTFMIYKSLVEVVNTVYLYICIYKKILKHDSNLEFIVFTWVNIVGLENLNKMVI